ncbi:hypothetical protein GDO78_013017 [Eleutherodactylus coqui]|uniref:PIPK domain-containing protein n=1 Tax=Eleutherodactylus coqui TaxID=57060 RepID=A0A8J6K719_ELECQ|nr:hypothetical protein GDO78_013017 [Eleutherodactylus coqui]
MERINKIRSQTGSRVSGESRGSSRRRRLFWKLRQRWKLLGLFEIDKDHEFYPLTCDLKEGLRDAVQDAIHSEATQSIPAEEDYSAKLTQGHEGYVMRTYAGPVFKYFRQSLGLSEESYQRSLASCGLYLQFISNSKSKADFFLTITRAQEKKKYFIIMQSVFFPDERITGRYDIKGCHVSRWTEPEPEGSRVLQVFKDLNFEGNVICLSQQRSWLLRQTELDTRFLQDLNVLDYSLLLGFQPLHQDEKSQGWSLASLIVRTKRSVNGPGSPTTSQCMSVPGVVEEEGETTDKEEEGTEFSDTPDTTSARRPPMKKIGQQVSAVSDISEVMAQNRRLLPNYKNPLHVMDGPELRYFIGIIDIFTVYGLKKKLEHLWKSMRYHGQEFSTVSPSRYAQRLYNWVDTHTV